MVRTAKLLLALTISIYFPSLLMFVQSQGGTSWRSWHVHVAYLIPAIIAGALGTWALNKPGPKAPLLGAGVCFLGTLIGTVVGCSVLTTPGSEAEAWYGVTQFPTALVATVAGAVAGSLRRTVPIAHSRPEQG